MVLSAEKSCFIACQMLHQDPGSILHVHQNVESFLGEEFQLPGSREIEEQKHCHYPQQIISDQRKYKATRVSVREMLVVATKPEWQKWTQSVETPIAILHQQEYSKAWRTQIRKTQPVKSYAAHVDHSPGSEL